MSISNSSTPKKPEKGPDDARTLTEENGIMHGDCASQKHAGSPVVYTHANSHTQTHTHTHTHTHTNTHTQDPGGNTYAAKGAGGRMGMGDVVGKEFERIFSGLFGGGGSVRSSNDSSSSAENGAAHSAPLAVVSKLDFSKVKDDDGGGRGGMHAANARMAAAGKQPAKCGRGGDGEREGLSKEVKVTAVEQTGGGAGGGGGGGGRAPQTSHSKTDHPKIQGETRTGGAEAPTNSHFAPTNLQPHAAAHVPSKSAAAPSLPPLEHAASSQRPSTVLTTGDTNTSASALGMGKPAMPSGGGGGLVLSVKEAAAAIRERSNVSMSMNALPVAIHSIPWPHGMPILTLPWLHGMPPPPPHSTLASWHASSSSSLYLGLMACWVGGWVGGWGWVGGCGCGCTYMHITYMHITYMHITLLYYIWTYVCR